MTEVEKAFLATAVAHESSGRELKHNVLSWAVKGTGVVNKQLVYIPA